MLILAVVSIVVIGVSAWNLWVPVTPVVATRAKAGAKVPSGTDNKTKVQQEKAEQQKKGETSSPAQGAVRQVYSSSSTLGDLSRFRGQKVLLEQQVKIAELEQRLKDLSQPKKQEIILPDLTPPKPKAEEQTTAITPAPKRGPVVVSVQGVAGALSATIRTADGRTVNVKNGAAFGGGRLQVTRRGVFVLRGGKPSAIPFE